MSGAFLAPFVCGTLGEKLGWHYGFAAAGVGMTIALAFYLYAMPMLPPDEMHKAKAAGLNKKPLDRNEWRAILALIALVPADHVLLGRVRAAGQSLSHSSEALAPEIAQDFTSGIVARPPVTPPPGWPPEPHK